MRTRPLILLTAVLAALDGGLAALLLHDHDALGGFPLFTHPGDSDYLHFGAIRTLFKLTLVVMVATVAVAARRPWGSGSTRMVAWSGLGLSLALNAAAFWASPTRPTASHLDPVSEVNDLARAAALVSAAAVFAIAVAVIAATSSRRTLASADTSPA